MKSEKGVTLTSIMIYIITLTVAVLIIGRITIYFYKNMNAVAANASAAAEYTKFNSYFTNEINVEGNEVVLCDENHNYIIFSKTENQYTFQNGSIYMNKTKISKDVTSCSFYYDEATQEISVTMEILGKEYNNTYTVTK